MELDSATLSYDGRWGTGTCYLPNAQKFIEGLPIVVMGFGGIVPEVRIFPNQDNNGEIFMEVPHGIVLRGLERIHSAGYEARLIYDDTNEDNPQLYIYKGLALIVTKQKKEGIKVRSHNSS
ncbi:MAG: hypothetical protein ABSG05_00315 [Candidatus Pacearchaeota archaeon]|jgi:hypothetical protein